MAAEDSLQPKQFYHGSDHEFQPGDQVLSPNALNERGITNNRMVSADSDNVFMTGTRAGAKGWGKHIYQVQPDTEPQRSWVGYGIHTAKSATVVKKINDKRLSKY